MQLWNHFLMSRKVLSLPQIVQACIDIRSVFKSIPIGWRPQIRSDQSEPTSEFENQKSHEYGAFIIENNLRRNFLLHLLNLVDHCLLKPSKVPDIMEIIG